MDEPSMDGWEYCRIERDTRRMHWWGRRRDGVFAALARDRPIARSARFPIPSPDDADIAAFHALLAQLGEEGWERWEEPRLSLGPAVFVVGYWHHTLRRRVVPSVLEGLASPDDLTREIDLPPPPALPPALLPPGAPIRRGAGGEAHPTDALPPAIRPPGNPVRRRTGHGRPGG